METIKIRNTEANKKMLENGNHSFSENTKTLSVTISDYHAMWINNGQMSVSTYKKKVLGI